MPLPVKLILAALLGMVIWRAGLAVLKGFAQPIPAPPPEGELRKIKRVYRCSSCGLEIRTIAAGSEDPEPPRHCMDEMDLIKTAEDFL